MKSRTTLQQIRLTIRWTLLLAVLGGSIYSYIYLGYQEPVLETIKTNTQLATGTGPEEGLVVLLAKAMKSLLGYI